MITDEMRRAIGTQAAPLSFEVERGAVQKFAEAVDDANPLWQEGYAPPSFLCTAGAGFTVRIELELPVKRLLVISDEMEFLQPVKVGDVITCNQTLAEIKEREGKQGQLLVVYENAFSNQRDELVARGRVTYLRY